MGEGAWEAFPEEARQLLTANGPALLAELDYVDEDMPDADEFASIEVPALLVAASDSPAPQREMRRPRCSRSLQRSSKAEDAPDLAIIRPAGR
jgi:hypothetical protein